MKKSTINRILIGIIALLVVAICILIIMITSRPKYINTNENETSNPIIEVPAIEPSTAIDPDNSSISGSVQEAGQPEIVRGKTSTKVNIRELDSSDSRVLKTVEAGYEFEIIEVMNNGWTKIKYDDSVAYISSLYVIILKQ